MGYFAEQAEKLQRLVGARYHHALHTPYPEMMETSDVRFERAAIEDAMREVAADTLRVSYLQGSRSSSVVFSALDAEAKEEKT